jgi:hypothetical protein
MGRHYYSRRFYNTLQAFLQLLEFRMIICQSTDSDSDSEVPLAAGAVQCAGLLRQGVRARAPASRSPYQPGCRQSRSGLPVNIRPGRRWMTRAGSGPVRRPCLF